MLICKLLLPAIISLSLVVAAQANHVGIVRDLHQKIRDGNNVVFWIEDGQSLPDSVWTPIVVALWGYNDLGWARAGVSFSYTQNEARADIKVYVDPDGCARWGLPGASCALPWLDRPCDIIFNQSALTVMPGGILLVNHEFGHCLGLHDHREREGYPNSIFSYHQPRIIEDVNDWRDVDLWPTDGDILRVMKLAGLVLEIADEESAVLPGGVPLLSDEAAASLELCNTQ